MSNNKLTVTPMCERADFETAFRGQLVAMERVYLDMTKFLATAGFFAVKDKSGVEVNIALALLEIYKPRDKALALRWFKAMFPLTEVKEKKVTVNGVERVLKPGLKYSEKAHNDLFEFKDKSAEVLFDAAFTTRFDVFKKLNTSNVEEARKPLTQEQLDKRLAKLREQADQDKLVFAVPTVGTGTVVDNYNTADLFYALNNVPRAGLTPAQRQFIDETLGKAVALGFLDANTLTPSSSEEPAKEAAA